MFRIRHFKNAGYPFGKNDLTIEEWEDLGKLEDVMRELNDRIPRPVYLLKR